MDLLENHHRSNRNLTKRVNQKSETDGEFAKLTPLDLHRQWFKEPF